MIETLRRDRWPRLYDQVIAQVFQQCCLAFVVSSIAAASPNVQSLLTACEAELPSKRSLCTLLMPGDVETTMTVTIPNRISKIHALTNALYLVSSRHEGAAAGDVRGYDIGLITAAGEYIPMPACSGHGELWRVHIDNGLSRVRMHLGWEEYRVTYVADCLSLPPRMYGPLERVLLGSAANDSRLYEVGAIDQFINAYDLTLTPLSALVVPDAGDDTLYVLDTVPEGAVVAVKKSGGRNEWGIALLGLADGAQIWTREVPAGMPRLMGYADGTANGERRGLFGYVPFEGGDMLNEVLDLTNGAVRNSIWGPIVKAKGLDTGGYVCVSTSGARREDNGRFHWSLVYTDSEGAPRAYSALYRGVAASELQGLESMVAALQCESDPISATSAYYTSLYSVPASTTADDVFNDTGLQAINGRALSGHWTMASCTPDGLTLVGWNDKQAYRVAVISISWNGLSPGGE